MEKERDRNINVWLPLTRPLLGTWPATQARALNWDRTSDPLLCRLVFDPLSHTSHGWFCIFKEQLEKTEKEESETDYGSQYLKYLLCPFTEVCNPCPRVTINKQ